MGFARSVKSPQRLMRIMSAKVDGTGTAALSGTCANDMALTDNGTGDYTLTFDVAYERAPEVVVTPLTADAVPRIAAVAVDSVQILMRKASDGTAIDADFHVMILGSDAIDAI